MAHAEKLEFEQAAELRNQMSALSRVLHQQSVEIAADKDVDILAVKVQGGKACVNLAMVRGGRHLGDRAYFPVHVEDATQIQHGERDAEGDDEPPLPDAVEVQVLEAFIAQHYIDVPVPATLVLSELVSRELIEAISQQAGTRVTAVFQPREQRRALAGDGMQERLAPACASACGGRLANRHARARWSTRSNWRRTSSTTSASSASTSRTPRARRRRLRASCSSITPCRTANTGATTSRASRRATTTPRCGRCCIAATASWPRRRKGTRPARMPELVLVDGGKGQVSMAREVFSELGVPLSLIVGVEKGEGRKVGLEELVFADGREKVYLGRDSAALMLVAQIRDEAHRFAITGMRAKRAKIRVGGSQLEDIPGIGPKRRARLLQRFGGIRGVAAASVEDIASVDGIAFDLAEEIYRALH